MKIAKITIPDHINAIVTGLDAYTKKQVSDMFRFFVPGAHVMPKFRLGYWDGHVSLFQNNTLAVNHVLEDAFIELLLKNGYDIEVDDQRIHNDVTIAEIDKTFLQEGKPGFELRPYQIDMVNDCRKHKNGIFVAGTGAGKSAVCAATTKSFLPFGRVVTIVPSIDLVVQTAKTFESFGVESGVYYGEEKVVKPSLVSTWQSLINVPELMDGVIAILCDEVHKYKAQEMDHFLRTCCSHIPHRYGYTGTLPKSSLGRTQLKGSIGPTIRTKDTYELQQEGYLADSDIEMIELAEPADIHPFHDPKHREWKKEIDHLTTNPDRLEWVVDYIKDICKTGNTIVFVNSYAAVDALKARLPDAIQIDGRIKPEKRQQHYREFGDMDNACMICTIQTASTGIDILRIFNVIFLEPGKSFIEVIQSVGRGLRRGGDKTALNIKDIYSNTKYSKKHAKERKSYYTEKRHKLKITKAGYLRGFK